MRIGEILGTLPFQSIIALCVICDLSVRTKARNGLNSLKTTRRSLLELLMDGIWPFEDAPDTACFTTSFVLDGSPVLRVYHDLDGDWQFHGPHEQSATSDVARLVSLEIMLRLTPAIQELIDLPRGWRAFRESPRHPWGREKNHPFPTFSENGYYLEDVVWLAECREDVAPPPGEVREALQAGQYVKLVFRFAAPNADREDYQCERIWVLLTEVDEDGNYIGMVENDPHHEQVLAYGDQVRFHPLHVMDVLDADDADEGDGEDGGQIVIDGA